MKQNTYRYILLLLVLITCRPIQALDNLGTTPFIPMSSTSVMQGSGSNIPLAAENGPFMYDQNVISISNAPAASRPQRVSRGDRPEGLVPIGTLPVLLMLLLCGGYVVVKKRRQSNLA